MFMLKNVVKNKFVIWRLFLHHCQLQLKNVKKFKIIPPHFEIENVTQNRRFLSTDVQFRVNAQAVQILTSNKSADNFQITVVMI